MGELGLDIAKLIGEVTLSKSTKLGWGNAEKNRPFFGKTLADLEGSRDGGAAIVIVGGPSLHRKNSVARIRDLGFKGDLIVADGSLGHCLRYGVVPQYVVTVDAHPYRIVRWFGDTELETRPEDDYFTRQDLDPAHWQNERKCNQELIDLVNCHGPRIKAIIATSVDPCVTRRCVESGMDLYWWNPMYDDYEIADSLTGRLVKANGIPCMVTGGNVGTSAWIFAHAILKHRHIALVGMDLGYAPGTPLRNTQYFTEIQELFKDRVEEAYIPIHNPHLNETWFTDPTYYWYRKVFLDLAKEADCTTYNCTEGGTLFGDDVPFIPLEHFIREFGNHG